MSATVVTITTAALTAGEIGTGLGIILVLSLIGLLVQRELASAVGARLGPLPRMLGLAIAPLLVAFVMIAAGRLLTAS